MNNYIVENRDHKRLVGTAIIKPSCELGMLNVQL